MLPHQGEPRTYLRIANNLREEIEAGQYEPSEPAPMVLQLAREYDCNKATVRKAYAILVEEDLIFYVRGLGYFVR